MSDKILKESLDRIKEIEESDDPFCLDETIVDENIFGDKAEELENIREQMQELLSEAEHLLRGSREWERARSYWYAHIAGALGESEFMGGSMVTMSDTIGELREAAEEEEFEEDVDQGAPTRKPRF